MVECARVPYRTGQRTSSRDQESETRPEREIIHQVPDGPIYRSEAQVQCDGVAAASRLLALREGGENRPEN